MAVQKKRTRRAKYINLYSPFLEKETKHELIGEPIESEKGRHQWARCTRSRHSQLINLDVIEAEQDNKSKAVVELSRDNEKKYNPTEEYNTGDVIYHTQWDDVGVVRAKSTLANGGKAIIVQFEKSGEKRLIENLQK